MNQKPNRKSCITRLAVDRLVDQLHVAVDRYATLVLHSQNQVTGRSTDMLLHLFKLRVGTDLFLLFLVHIVHVTGKSTDVFLCATSLLLCCFGLADLQFSGLSPTKVKKLYQLDFMSSPHNVVT